MKKSFIFYYYILHEPEYTFFFPCKTQTTWRNTVSKISKLQNSSNFVHRSNRNKNRKNYERKENLGELFYIASEYLWRLIKKEKFQLSWIIPNEARVEKMAENCHGKEPEKSSWRGLCIQKLHLVAYITGDAIRPSNFPARLRRNSAVSDFFRRRRASPSRVIAFPRNRWTSRVITGDFIRQSARGKRPIQPTSLGKLSQLFDESRYSSLVDALEISLSIIPRWIILDNWSIKGIKMTVSSYESRIIEERMECKNATWWKEFCKISNNKI